MLILNFKTYTSLSGNSLLPVLQIVAEVTEAHPELVGKIFVAPAMIELAFAKAMQPQLGYLAQSVDNMSQGKGTGRTPFTLVKEIGVEYVLANHSENRIGIEETIAQIKAAKDLGIHIIACCENAAEAKQLLEAEPYAILYEPPELIGSGVSVTNKPEAVTEFVQLLAGSNVKAIIGAGVSNAQDIKQSLNFGAYGVCLASAFANAEDKKNFLLELASAML